MKLTFKLSKFLKLATLGVRDFDLPVIGYDELGCGRVVGESASPKPPANSQITLSSIKLSHYVTSELLSCFRKQGSPVISKLFYASKHFCILLKINFHAM
jgi:hypothetical protein